jgi:hypothetical protein
MAVSRTTRQVDAYEVAFLAGGADRVIDTAIVALVLAGRLRVHSAGELEVVEVAGRHPIEAAVHDAVGPSGHRAVDTIHWRLADDHRLLDLGRRLQNYGLVTRFGARGVKRWKPSEVVRLTGEGRRTLADAREQRSEMDDAWRVAFDGRAAMQDARLRTDIFEPPRREREEGERKATLERPLPSDASIAAQRQRNSFIRFESQDI